MKKHTNRQARVPKLLDLYDFSYKTPFFGAFFEILYVFSHKNSFQRHQCTN